MLLQEHPINNVGILVCHLQESAFSSSKIAPLSMPVWHVYSCAFKSVCHMPSVKVQYQRFGLDRFFFKVCALLDILMAFGL